MDNRAATLVSPKWLSENLGKVKLLDASWHMPHEKRDINADFIKSRIPGAVLFDIDAIADKSTALPHMLPSIKQFEDEVGKLGVSNYDTVVAYDTTGKFVASARLWWTFRVFGHKQILVLDGGLPQWIKQGYPTTSGVPDQPRKTKYRAHMDSHLVKTLDQMKANLSDPSFEVVDARPADRFFGRTAEPRPGLKSGHIPNTKNVPWASVLDPTNMTFLANDEILNAFKRSNVSLQGPPLVTSCGSGVTAAVLSLGLHLNGIDSAIYDGSFTEWGQPSQNLPVHAAEK